MSIQANTYPIFGPFIGLMGGVSCVALSFSGAAYGTVKTARTVTQCNWKSFIPMGMTLPLLFYGTVMTILIIGRIDESYYSLYNGFLHLGAGLCVGISCLIAGISIGYIGQSTIKVMLLRDEELSTGDRSQSYFCCTMFLNLMFCQVLALCGFFVSIYIYTMK